jgi:hypothetical protein
LRDVVFILGRFCVLETAVDSRVVFYNHNSLFSLVFLPLSLGYLGTLSRLLRVEVER